MNDEDGLDRSSLIVHRHRSMSKDNIVYSACGLLLGLVVGTFLIGPKLVKSPLAAAPAAPAMNVAGGATTQATAPDLNGQMAMVRQQLDALKQKVAANPNDFDSLVQLGNMYSDVAKFPQAIDYYERALRVREDANVRTDLGICYKQAGRLDDALAAFRKVSDESPQSWQAVYNLAIVDGEMKKFEEARVQLAKLKQMRPGDPNVAKLEQALAQVK
jgi:tetratricopeptide (TPR) repeat protein